MKIKEIDGKNGDEQATYSLEVDGKRVLSVYPMCECPEDATLERDLNFAYNIVGLMRKAHAAGAAGQPFEVEQAVNED